MTKVYLLSCTMYNRDYHADLTAGIFSSWELATKYVESVVDEGDGEWEYKVQTGFDRWEPNNLDDRHQKRVYKFYINEHELDEPYLLEVMLGRRAIIEQQDRCEHTHLSTVARIVEAGVSCPLCT